MLHLLARPVSYVLTACFCFGSHLVAEEGRHEEEGLIGPEATVLEFRSMVTLGNSTYYSLHQPENGRRLWVSDQEVRDGIEIVDFRAEENLLTVYNGGELQQLTLSRSQVAELPPPSVAEEERRRESRTERRERFREFQSNWREATQTSEELARLDGELRELATEFRQARNLRRQAERGTEERLRLLEQEREIGREIRLMSEYTALRADQDASFQAERDGGVDRVTRMVRYNAFSRRSNQR